MRMQNVKLWALRLSFLSGALILIAAIIFLLFRFWSVLEESRFENLIKQGNQAFVQKNYKLAQDFYQEAQSLSADLPARAEFNWGQIAFRQGELAVAQKHFQQALTKDPSLLSAHYFLALIFIPSDLESAIKELTIIELQDEKAGILQRKLQRAYESLNETYRKAELGFILLEEDQPLLASLILEKAVAEKPNYRDAYLLLAAAYLKMAKFESTEAALQKAAEIDPNYAATFKLLGQLYEAWGKNDLAQKNFERAEKLLK